MNKAEIIRYYSSIGSGDMPYMWERFNAFKEKRGPFYIPGIGDFYHYKCNNLIVELLFAYKNNISDLNNQKVKNKTLKWLYKMFVGANRSLFQETYVDFCDRRRAFIQKRLRSADWEKEGFTKPTLLSYRALKLDGYTFCNRFWLANKAKVLCNRRSVTAINFSHPHVFGDREGSSCLGDFERQMENAFNNNNALVYKNLLMQWLNCFYPESAYGTPDKMTVGRVYWKLRSGDMKYITRDDMAMLINTALSVAGSENYVDLLDKLSDEDLLEWKANGDNMNFDSTLKLFIDSDDTVIETVDLDLRGDGLYVEEEGLENEILDLINNFNQHTVA